jgi:DNA-binding transcriptional ArsR family regulator
MPVRLVKPIKPIKPSELSAIFDALADRHRRWMIKLLCSGPAPASELAGQLPVTLPAAMRHLRVLEQSGLIESEKVGRVRMCTLKPERLHLAEAWLAKHQRLGFNR